MDAGKTKAELESIPIRDMRKHAMIQFHPRRQREDGSVDIGHSNRLVFLKTVPRGRRNTQRSRRRRNVTF